MPGWNAVIREPVRKPRFKNTVCNNSLYGFDKHDNGDTSQRDPNALLLGLLCFETYPADSVFE